MKKLILKSLSLIAGLLVSTNATAYDFKVDGIYYSINGENAIVTNETSSYSSNYSGDVVIPETVTYEGTTYNVTTIGAYAFWSCSTLTSITIPSSITTIQGSAFHSCNGLKGVYISDIAKWCEIEFGSNPLEYSEKFYLNNKQVTDLIIPEGVTEIKNNTFSKCSGVTSVTIPNSVTSIGSNAFRYSGISSISIGKNVTSIGFQAFDGCKSLTSIIIPNSVTTIESTAFYQCSGLTSITIGNGVKNIGQYVFSGCGALTSVYISDIAKWCDIEFYDSNSNPLTYAKRLYLNNKRVRELVIPENVTTIKKYSFFNCTGLTSVTTGNGVNEIGTSAFYGCSDLASINIGSNVTTIRDYAFNNSGVTSVTIPDNVTLIEENAFRGCSNLSSVVIGNGASKIAPYTFSGCNSLISVELGDNITAIGDYAFNGCSSLPSIIIPNNVISIGSYAFNACSELISATIGRNTNKIMNCAFYNCSKLATINSLNPNPPLIYNQTFNNVDKTVCELNVPVGSKIDYQLEDYWKDFLNINEVDFELSGSEDIEIGNNGITIVAANGNIVVNGVSDNTIVEVYNMSGQLVYSGYDNNIAIKNNGIYLVKVNNTIHKIAL